MTRPGLASALVVSVAVAVSAVPPEVSVDGLGVRIVADGSPLDRLLGELAEATGMEIIYEATPPSLRVTAELQAQTPAEAVVRLLDGLPVSYALQLDASGERVSKLWIAGKSSGSRPGRRAAPAARPARRPPPPPAAETEEPDAGDPVEDQPPVSGDEPASDEPTQITPRAFPTPLVMPTPPPPAATPTPRAQG